VSDEACQEIRSLPWSIVDSLAKVCGIDVTWVLLDSVLGAAAQQRERRLVDS
jgi:hypothetical protein